MSSKFRESQVEIDSDNKHTISDWKMNAIRPKLDSIN